MARARNIKPGFFCNADLIELEPLTRLLFIGMWTIADRLGRLDDRPKYIKIQLLPGDNCDVDSMLNDLQRAGFILRYEVDTIKYIQIVNFDKHQHPHKDEKQSIIPAPCKHHASTMQAPEIHQTNPADCLNRIPDSFNLIDREESSSSSPLAMTREREPDPEMQTATKMTINDVRFLYQATFGQNMPGGCNQTANDMCQRFSAAGIRQAFEAAAVHNKPNMAYVLGILNGGSKKPGARASPARSENRRENERREAAQRLLERMENGNQPQDNGAFEVGRSVRCSV